MHLGPLGPVDAETGRAADLREYWTTRAGTHRLAVGWRREDEATSCEFEAEKRREPLRPGWLADDTTWREYLDAMPYEDRRFLTESWELAGGKPPRLDTSWIQMESIGGGPRWLTEAPFWVVMTAVVVGMPALVVGMALLAGVLR